MRDQPTGDQLLDTARTVLREELIPALPAQKRHAALMIANAMSIALRQLQSGDEPERQEVAALKSLLLAGDGRDIEADLGTREQLRRLNRELCESIRGGRADSGTFHDAVREHLVEVATKKVLESNPKYLGSAR